MDSDPLAELSQLAFGDADGEAPPEASEPARAIGRQFADTSIQPGIGITSGVMRPFIEEVGRGYQQAQAGAGAAVALPENRTGILSWLARLSMGPAGATMPEAAIRPLAESLSKRAEAIMPGPDLTMWKDSAANQVAATRGFMQGTREGQREGYIYDVARGLGQSAPMVLATAGAVATGGALLPVGLASTAQVPLAGYTEGQLEYLDELDEARAKAAAEGKPLPGFDLAEMQARGAVKGAIEGAVEAGGATAGATALGRWVLGSKPARAVLGPLAAKGAEMVAKTAVGDAASRFMFGAVERGFIRKVGAAVAISAAEEGGEELASALLNAPFTAKPLSKDLADGLYASFVGAGAGGLGGGAVSAGVAARDTVRNVRETFAPESVFDAELRRRHELARSIDPSGTLTKVADESAAVGSDYIASLRPEERPVYLSMLADRVADTTKAADDLLAARQQLDYALVAAREGNETEKQVAKSIEEQIADIDQRLQEVRADRVKAEAEWQGARDSIGSTVERADADTVLADMAGKIPGLSRASKPSWGSRIEREIEAMGGEVVWFDGWKRGGFFSMRSPGTVYLNASLSPAKARAVALEEVFHTLQMHRPEVAKVFMDRVAMGSVYRSGARYILKESGSEPINMAAIERLAVEAGIESGPESAPRMAAGSARIEEEGGANAFAGAAEPMLGPLSGLYRAASRMGLRGRDAAAAVAVLDAIERSAALAERGPTDFALSPLARTLLWAKRSPLDYAIEIGKIEASERSEAEDTVSMSEVSKAIADDMGTSDPVEQERRIAALEALSSGVQAGGPPESGVFDASNPPRPSSPRAGGSVVAVMTSDGKVYYDRAAEMHGDLAEKFPEIVDYIIDGGFIVDGKYKWGHSDGGYSARDAEPDVQRDVARMAREVNRVRKPATDPTVSTASQIDTPEFKRWFGKSKVVDADGKPLVVYHGTRALFDAFDPGRIGDQGRSEGPGFYFTESPQIASRYAGDSGTVVNAYLRIENPLAYDAPPFSERVMRDILLRASKIESERSGSSESDGLLANFGDTYGPGGVRAAASQGAKLFMSENDALSQIGGLVGSGVSPDIVMEAVTAVTGHDGVVSRGFSNEGRSDERIFVAFSPTQIKSATGNSGAFDPNDPRISYSSEAVESWAKAEFGDRVAPNGRKVWENFVRAFGNSKVVDKSGKPLVVYRGDRDNKEQFADTGPTRVMGNVFFTDQRSIGERYAKRGRLYEAFLSLQNPYIVDAGFAGWIEVPAPPEVKASWGDPDKTLQIDDLAAWARRQGYDGLIVRNVIDQYGGGTQYVAFFPTQIKSATDNNGNFDPADPRISYASELPELPLAKEIAAELDKARAAVAAASTKLTEAKRTKGGKDARIDEARRELAKAKDAERSIRMRLAETTRAYRTMLAIGQREARLSGVVGGMMEARKVLLDRMRAREDAVARMVAGLREAYTQRSKDRTENMKAALAIAAEAGKIVPARVRGDLLNRVSKATTLERAFKVAHAAVRIAADAMASDARKNIARVRKRMNRVGMRNATAARIDGLLAEAETELRDASGKVLRSRGGVIGAVDLFSRVASAVAKVDEAVATYAVDRAEWNAAKEARQQRYADLRERLLESLEKRPHLKASESAVDAPDMIRLRFRRANSDWYTFALELEGKNAGVMDEIMTVLQRAKGASALEKAEIVRSLAPAFAAAGYADMAEYALRGGSFGHASTENVTVQMGGKSIVMPKGIALSIAAMDDSTLNLFPVAGDKEARPQGIVIRGAETAAEYFPTREEVEAIRAMFTPSEMGLVRAMKSVLEGRIRDRVMQEVYAIEGAEPPVEPGYWPRVRYMGAKGGDTITIGTEPSEAIKSALTNVGFAKARVQSRAPLVYSDAVQTFLDHIGTALDIVYMAQPYRDAMSVLGDDAVVRHMDGIMGPGTSDAVRSIVVSGVGAAQQSRGGIVDSLNRNVAGAVLAFNPQTWAKTALGGAVRLASEIPASHLATGIARGFNPVNRSERVESVHRMNGYFLSRHSMNMAALFGGSLSESARAGFLTNMRAAYNSLKSAGHLAAAGELKAFMDRLAEGSASLSQAATAAADVLRLIDEDLMLVAYEARLAQVMAEGRLTPQEARNEAAMRAERDFRLTQNVSDQFDDTGFASMARVKGDRLSRALFPFASDPLKARNQLRRAMLDPSRRAGTALALGGNLAINQGVRAASAAIGLLAYAALSAMSGDDEDGLADPLMAAKARAFRKDIGSDAAAEVLGQTGGYVGLILAQVLRRVATGYGSALQPLAARPIEQVAGGVSAMSGAETASDVVAGAVDAVGSASQLAGLPFWTTWRWAERTFAEAVSEEARRKAAATELRRQRKEETITPEGRTLLRQIERENRREREAEKRAED